jgi:NTE family protein
MTKKLAFVLSGGGSRGALQVGALYALLEAGIRPDLLIGASVGSVNATYLAVNGFSQESLDALKTAWKTANTVNLLPANYVWLTVRAMFNRSSNDPSQRLRDFFIDHGVNPELSFADLTHTELAIVSADLNTGKPIVHGERPQEKILDALLLSTALPPWFMPVRRQESYLIDGGVLSNLPIEPAIKYGATQVVALDLIDSREILGAVDGLRGFLERLIYSIERRQVDLELELAEARGVPLLYLGLTGEKPVPIWDFKHTDELIEQGYDVARHIIATQQYSNPIFTSLD